MPASELEKRLFALEQEQNRQEKEVTQLTTDIAPAPKKVSQKPQSKNGFVIRLDFGAGAPISEWSDETHGWRSKDLGTSYPSEQHALQRLSELKTKWPDYPLSLFEVIP